MALKCCSGRGGKVWAPWHSGTGPPLKHSRGPTTFTVEHRGVGSTGSKETLRHLSRKAAWGEGLSQEGRSSLAQHFPNSVCCAVI